MADEIKTIVRQDSYSVTPEGSQGMVRLNPRGELVTPDWQTQLVLDGRVFNASNAVQETLEDISVTTVGTANIYPALLLDVPSGKTAIPLEVMLDMGTDGSDEDIAVRINIDDAARYSSGGGAITPINMRKDDPRTSGCTFKSGSAAITASANTDDDTIFSCWVPQESTPKSGASLPLVYWSARQFTPPVLIGPASLLVYIVSATADATWNYSVKWAEFDTVEIT